MDPAPRRGFRPEGPWAPSRVPAALGITASPVSAAMAAYLTLLPEDFTLTDILVITIPASIVACIATSLVQQRIGAELKDDPRYLELAAAGEVDVPEKVMVTLPAETQTAARAAAAAKLAGTGGGVAVITADEPVGGDESSIARHGRTSALIFLAGVAFIVLMGLFEDL